MIRIVDFVLGANCVGPAYSLSEGIFAWLKAHAVLIAVIIGVIVVLCLVVVVVVVMRVEHRASTRALNGDGNSENMEDALNGK